MKPTLPTLLLSCVLGLGPMALASAEVPCEPELAGLGLSYAGNVPDTTDFVDTALELGAEFGAENTLVVMDIDNTLVAMLDDLGSEQWFEWQHWNRLHRKRRPEGARMANR